MKTFPGQDFIFSGDETEQYKRICNGIPAVGKYKISDLVDRQAAIHCNTKEEINTLLKYFDIYKYKWDSNFELAKHNLSNLYETIGIIIKTKRGIFWHNLENLVEICFAIIKFEELELEE